MQSIPWLKGKFHVPESLWRKHQYLELYPLDGGTSFIVDEFVGTRDDREITERLASGKLLEKWGKPGDMEWTRHGEAKNMELYAWLHRWYYIPSVARMYFLEHKEAHAELVFRILDDWVRKMGYPKTREEAYALEEKALAFDYKHQRSLLPSLEEHCPWEWFDFQPAYRLLVLLVTAQLLKESRVMQKRSREMLEWIVGHANATYWITEKFGFKRGNHHSLRMMSLYLAGEHIEHDNAEGWRRTALEMQERHAREDYFEDGMCKESLPGYFPFIVTHVREVLLSAKANGREIPGRFEETVRKALGLMKAMVMPDGFLPVINDGPRVNIRGMIDLIEHYYPSGKDAVKAFMVNKASGFPIFHDKRNYLVFNVNYSPAGHVQAGKLGIILWRDDEPFVIEAGCCNYDNPDFQPYFRRGWAHSTLLVDGEEDGVWKAFWVWEQLARPEIKEFSEGERPFVRVESDGFKRMGIRFERKIEQHDADSFVITDEIRNEMKKERTFTFRFMLAQEDVKKDSKKNEVRIRGKKNTLTIRASKDAEIEVKRVKSNFFGDMREVPCVDFVLKSAGDFTQSFELRFS